MSLRAKLLWALAPLALVLIALGTISVRGMTSLGEGAELILKDNYRSVLAAQRMKDSLDRIDRGQADQQVFEEELLAQEQNITEPGEAEATRELRNAWETYKKMPRQAAYDRVRAAADRVLLLNQDAMVLKSERARRAAQHTTALMIIATLIAFFIGLAASGALTARLLRPLGVLSQAVRRLGRGDLQARAQVQASSDEIGSLARDFNTMAESLAEYRRSSLGELIQAQQAAQATIDSLPDPILVLDRAGAVLNQNDAAEELFKGGQAPPELQAIIDKVRAHVMAGGGAYVPKGFEEAVAAPGARQLLPRAAPTDSGVTIVLQDVTRLMRFDELKNDLVATVAHELRTPLTSLRMAVHLCLEEAAGPLTEKQAELLHAAREDCERLQTIVDDLLDLSRMQSGRVEVSPVPVSPKALAEAAEPKAIVTVVEPISPVLADPERIGLVLHNLLQNAARYSEHVELRVEPFEGRVRFSVLDRGPGVPAEFRERIFDKFFRVPGAKGEGIGLGLYISREIVQAHGGAIGVDEAPGGGSRFWFTLDTVP
ncbi:MAG TPA: ATP-binding protein [Myxococcales bacterium]|nr:ATP-binding protein [Myxococcales bacterium]